MLHFRNMCYIVVKSTRARYSSKSSFGTYWLDELEEIPMPRYMAHIRNL
jgi:hypothetical protein